MALVRLSNVGALGINRDLSNHELPPTKDDMRIAWTDGRNIRFLNGYAWQFYGYGSVYGTPTVEPYNILPCTVGTTRYFLYAGTSAIYAVTNSGAVAVHTDLTQQSGGVDVTYTGGVNLWTSTLLGGIPVFNNGTDAPQSWNLNIADRMTDLANWPASTTCKALRSFQNILVALNVTKSGTTYPFMVKWSHPADPGTVPSSWDPSDATKLAGETDLAIGYDPIVDGMQLRNALIIYKEASVWRMDFIGGTFVNQFTQVLGTSGALNRNCIVEIDGFHVVLTNSDVIVHDGQSAQSCLDRQMRRWLFQNIDATNAGAAFVFKNPFFNEAYICFPSIGSTACDKAIVWAGPVDNGLTGNWNQDSAPWASDLTAWNGPDYVPSNARALMGGAGPKLYLLDATASFDGAQPTMYLERRGLSLGSPETRKLVRGLRPRVVGNTGDTIIFKVGSQTDPWADPVYGAAMTHTIGSTVANDCFVDGRYIAIRMENGTAYQARLDSIDIDVVTAGVW